MGRHKPFDKRHLFGMIIISGLYLNKEMGVIGLAEKDIAATLRSLTKEALALGLEVECDPDAYEVSPRGKVTHITIEVYERGEDSEPVGLMLTDLQTYQWRRVYSKLATGTADQGLAGAKRLLALVAQEFKAGA